MTRVTVALSLALLALSMGCCQTDPVIHSGVLRVDEPACTGYLWRITRQSDTLQIQIARPDGSQPVLVFERSGDVFALRASPGLPITGELVARDCPGGVAISGTITGDACVSLMARVARCIGGP